jgi:hypothetical protein
MSVISSDCPVRIATPRGQVCASPARSRRAARTVGGRAVDVRDADVAHLPVPEQVDAAPVREARNRRRMRSSSLREVE